jgi:splicing factor 3B subunit 3
LPAFVRVQGAERVVVGDSSDSVFFVHYSKQENAMHIFADDVTSRMCSTGELLDYNTVAAGDKNGNVFVLRLPPGASGDDTHSRAAAQRQGLWDQGQASGAPHKLDLLCHFYVGECVTGLAKCQLSLGHSEAIVYTTVFGTIGTLCPFPSRDDLDFFAHLELQMRKLNLSIVGRDHLQFRSYYAPCKQVVDGDLCEQFGLLDVSLQTKVAKELDKTPLEVLKRIEDARALVLW